jgi:hypothetical protein
VYQLDDLGRVESIEVQRDALNFTD